VATGHFPKIQSALTFFSITFWLWLQKAQVDKRADFTKHLHPLKVFIHNLIENVDEKATRYEQFYN